MRTVKNSDKILKPRESSPRAGTARGWENFMYAHARSCKDAIITYRAEVKISSGQVGTDHGLHSHSVYTGIGSDRTVFYIYMYRA